MTVKHAGSTLARIAFIAPEYPGCGPNFGIGKYIFDLANLFLQLGHPVLVLVAGDTGCFSVTSDGQPRQELSSKKPFLLRPWLARHWLRAHLKEFKPDIVEVSNWGALGICFGKSWPVAVRLSTSAADADGTRPDHLRWLRVKSEHLQVHQANVVIADSHAMANRAQSLYGRRAEVVIPHGWNGKRLNNPTWKERSKHVLFVGRLEPRKGVDVLASAWPQVVAQCPDAWLHIVGKGTIPSLPERATAYGWLSEADLDGLRRTCRAQAIPSRFESFGLVALEAWAHGLVPVTSDTGALAEIIEDAGLTSLVNDPHRLAQSLITALNLDQDHLISKGRHLLETRYASDIWAKATLLAYEQAIKAHGMRRGS